MNIAQIIPVNSIAKLSASKIMNIWQEHIQNQISFWNKISLPVEIVFIVSPNCSPFTDTELQKIEHPSNLSFKLISNNSKISNGQSIQQALSLNKSDILVIQSLDLSLPLGELLKGAMDFIQRQDQLGSKELIMSVNRLSPSKAWLDDRKQSQRIYEDIEREKSRKLSTALNLTDVITPHLFISQSAVEKIKNLEFRKHFYTPLLLQNAHNLNIKICETNLKGSHSKLSPIHLWDLFR